MEIGAAKGSGWETDWEELQICCEVSLWEILGKSATAGGGNAVQQQRKWVYITPMTKISVPHRAMPVAHKMHIAHYQDDTAIGCD
jgi:hypothetical protein